MNRRSPVSAFYIRRLANRRAIAIYLNQSSLWLNRMITQKPQNLFFSTTFFLILLGGAFYSEPIILSILKEGFTPERGFDLAKGFVLGAIATKNKMNDESTYTPHGILGRDKEVAIASIVAAQVPTILEASKAVANTIDAVQEAEQTVRTAVEPISDIAQAIAQNDPTVQAIADVVENPFEALKRVRL